MRLTKNQLLILSVLLRHPMHPYAIRQEIIKLTSHKEWLSKSSVHNALNMLINKSYAEECISNPHYWLKAKRGVPYELTESGYWATRRELSMHYAIFVKTRHWLELIGDGQPPVLN